MSGMEELGIKAHGMEAYRIRLGMRNGIYGGLKKLGMRGIKMRGKGHEDMMVI